MKELKPGDHVVGMALDGRTIEVFKVVKAGPDGVQVEETSGNLSKAGLRAYDEKIVEQIREKYAAVRGLKQEIMDLHEKLEPVG